MLRGRALVVDDQPDWRTTIAGLLKDQGFETWLASSQSEALTILAREPIDVAVLDVRLDETDESNKDGLQLMRAIAATYPAIGVIMLTGYADVEMVQEALQPNAEGVAPAFGFLQKQPPDIAQLPDYAKRVLLKRNVPKFAPQLFDELLITLDPGEPLRVEGRGSIFFTYTSQDPFKPEVERANQWGNEKMFQSADRRGRIKEAGKELYRWIFEQHPVVRDSYMIGWLKGHRNLHLRFECDRKLARVPLEFLFSEKAGDHSALLQPMSRKIRGLITRRESVSPDFIQRVTSWGEPLRVLLIVSNTTPRHDLIDAIGEDICALLSPIKWIDLTILRTPEATIDNVRQILKACKFDIVHYVGHGEFRADSPEQSALRFWDGTTNTAEIKSLTGNELRPLLENSDVRLMHLTACEGVQSGMSADLLDDDYLGIADAIIQAGVPAVLGYRWPVSVYNARKMTLAFYRSFLQHGSPELALLDARQELAGPNKDDLTWTSPILISQS